MNETSRVQSHLPHVLASRPLRPLNWDDFGDLEDFDEPSPREGEDTIVVRVPSIGGRGTPFLDEGRPTSHRDPFAERETPRSRAPAVLSWKPFSALRIAR